MRVAIVHRVFSRTGGTERFGWDLARALVAAGDEVHLVGSGLDAPVEGATFHRVGALSAGRTARMLGFMHQSSRLLHALNKKAGFDVVLGLGRTLEQDVLRVGGGCHASYLEAVEGWQDGRPPSPLLPQVYNRLALDIERKQMGLQRTRHIVAVSRRVKEELTARYHLPDAAISVVHNGVDLERFNPARLEPARAEIREKYGIPPEALVLLFVGNGLLRKGFFTLLEGFARFAGEARRQQLTAPLYLLVVSRDAERQQRSLAPFLQRIAALNARIELAGAQSAVERYYAASDVLVLPTRYEPFGNVCLEAMAMGLPVITSRVNGAAELMRGSLASLQLEQADDAAALVDRLLRLRDPALRRELGDEGRQVAQERSIQRNAAEIRAILAASRRGAAAGRETPHWKPGPT